MRVVEIRVRITLQAMGRDVALHAPASHVWNL